MSSNEVSQPILNSPFREPECFWYLREGETAPEAGWSKAVVRIRAS